MATEPIKFISAADQNFPPLLREIPLPPEGLYYLGEIENNSPCLAIVGTRKATKIGIETAYRFAVAAARAGITIVSGLALGIDAAAHAGALDAKGRTVAVLANGLDTIYPKQNEALARKILAAGGALISEYPPETPSYPNQFLARNRIVSGLSKVILIVEAPKRSGTLATARFAIEQNRELCIIPGSIANPNYEGSLELLKSGAMLTTAPEEVLELFGIKNSQTAVSATPKLSRENLKKMDENQQKILLLLEAENESMEVDAICKKTALSNTLVNQTLAFLVIEGIIKEEGGRYRL